MKTKDINLIPIEKLNNDYSNYTGCTFNYNGMAVKIVETLDNMVIVERAAKGGTYKMALQKFDLYELEQEGNFNPRYY